MNGLFYLRIRMSICVVSLADFHGAGTRQATTMVLNIVWLNRTIIRKSSNQMRTGVLMGKMLGISIQNYGSLKDITMGKLSRTDGKEELGNMVAVIGSSGSGKSTLTDAFRR